MLRLDKQKNKKYITHILIIHGVAYEITLNNGEKLTATWSHPIYVKDVGEVQVQSLRVGDILINKDNNEIKIKEINKNKIIDKPVYEIWVENNRNYFVGNSSILVYSEREVMQCQK